MSKRRRDSLLKLTLTADHQGWRWSVTGVWLIGFFSFLFWAVLGKKKRLFHSSPFPFLLGFMNRSWWRDTSARWWSWASPTAEIHRTCCRTSTRLRKSSKTRSLPCRSCTYSRGSCTSTSTSNSTSTSTSQCWPHVHQTGEANYGSSYLYINSDKCERKERSRKVLRV